MSGTAVGVAPSTIDALRRLTSPTVSNAIERFGVRPWNEGFTDPSIRCLSPTLGPSVGFAATMTIDSRTAAPSDHWLDDFKERSAAGWRHLLSLPTPRIIVVQDLADPPFGALWGEVNAAIHRALGCWAVVTNGTVRDLPEMEAGGFASFAAGLCVSHAYVRIVDVGVPVTVGGLDVHPGDLLHADLHGVVKVPLEVADRVPEVAHEIEATERRTIAYCNSSQFTLDGLLSGERLSVEH